MKALKDMTERELTVHEIHSHLQGIIDTAQRMTSGNYMHHTNSIRLSAQICIDRLNALGIKDIE